MSLLVAPLLSRSKSATQGARSFQLTRASLLTAFSISMIQQNCTRSQQIPVNSCAFGTVLMVANTEEYNLPDLVLNNTWTLNTNDLTFGVHVVEITGTVVSTKVGPVNSTGQTVYNYLGCFQESTGGSRLFPNEPVGPSQNNTNGNCQTICYDAKQYAFAGTEFGTECWCGNIPPPLANQDTLDIYCNFACPGDGNDRCGAAGYLSVYYDPTKYVAGADPSLYGPQTIQSAGNYNYIGCYSEGSGTRALTGLTPKAPADGFTIELCEAACQGYTYFGMEYSNQCYCGNTILGGAANQTSSVPTTNGCSMTCTGNQNEYCGGTFYCIPQSASSNTDVLIGANRLDMYQINGSAPISSTSSSAPTLNRDWLLCSTTTTSQHQHPGGPYTVQSLPGWTYYGCWTEATTGRALAALQNPAAAVPVSVESCGLACAAYSYFGVEYAGECYCGNTFSAGSTIAPGGSLPAANGCNMVCKGNSSEYCGGSLRLNVYQAVSLSTSSSSSSSTPSLSVYSTTSTSSSSTPTQTGPITVTNLYWLDLPGLL